MYFDAFGKPWPFSGTAIHCPSAPRPPSTGAAARSLLHNVPLDELKRYANEGDRRSAEALAVHLGLEALGIGIRAIGRAVSA